MTEKVAVDSASVRFEAVDADDFEALLALRIEAMRASLEQIGRFDPERARQRFRDSFSAPHSHHIVVDGVRVGFVTSKPLASGLLLDHLYVRPSHQGRGIGAAVLKSLFMRADRERLTIRVGALRDSASNRFYVRHGFRLVDEQEWDLYYERSPEHHT